MQVFNNMNEFVQKLLTLDLTMLGVIFGIGFVTLVYTIGKLARQRWFVSQFRKQYIQTVNNLNDKNFDQNSQRCYQWLQRNLCVLKKDMREHGVGNFGYINSAITHLHDRPDILPPNLGTVCVYLEQYTGMLNCLIKKKLLFFVCIPLWPVQVVELVVIVLRACGIGDFNSNSTVNRIIKIIFYVYTVIAGWDAVVKKLKSFL